MQSAARTSWASTSTPRRTSSKTLPDGGRVVLERDDAADTAAIAAIRVHMREIAVSFRAGDFTKPFQVHAQTVPGTAVMRDRRARDQLTCRSIAAGRGVRITSRTPPRVRDSRVSRVPARAASGRGATRG